ncbi:MAG: sulfate transporter [Micavibrio aeruginosavorus]|uniref:Sulfate transporter n=1 Tax=Micavibrio aeruginosavorus TaxID=349221 RepID=A0A2W5PNQ0_9BACT|nr:MAG: sulfate transporter [Micavibrio aeruginosavorus]
MNEFMIDSKGRHVPLKNIRETDLLENQLVDGLMSRAEAVSESIGKFKGEAFSDINAFMNLLEEKYAASIGGKKGNLTLMSFDGLKKVQVAISDSIDFGPQLQIAKNLIDECINTWTADGNTNVRALVDHAFDVGKNQRLNTKNILGLRRLNIDDEKWKRAMDTISEAVRVVSSKQYIRFYSRENREAEFTSVSLDIASA